MVEFNIDQIAGEIDSGSFDLGGEGTPSPVPGAPQNQGSAFDPNAVLTYKARGKEIQEPLSMVLQRASMGYDYATLMQQFKQQQSEFQAQQQQLKSLEEKWKPYEDYANSNPQWADHVRQSWESRFSFGQANPNENAGFQNPAEQVQNPSLPPEVAAELSKMKSFISQYEQEKQMAMQAEQDAQLASEINSVMSEYPEYDLHATDPQTGENLEQQILRHAQTYGIGSFRAAFRDMMFDKLLARGQTQAKETVAKQMQQQVKNGVLAQSNTPLLQRDMSGVNMKGHSYHSLMDMAAKELGF
jgi:hypothetical protein